MDLWEAAYRALGPIQSSREHAEVRQCGLPNGVVVGRGQGGQGAATFLITRRNALLLSAGAIAAAKFATPAQAQVQEGVERHGMSAFGDLNYPADFKNFAYVNPDVPKGGSYSECISSRGYNGSFLTFNSLNSYILKGEGVFGMDRTFAALMASSGDEPAFL